MTNTIKHFVIFIIFNFYIYNTVSINNDRSKLLFYIYDGLEWGNISIASMEKRDPNEVLEHTQNFGAGPVVSNSRGSFHTDQYQLFSNLYFRALRDPRRTFDPSLATSFIIPYDLAQDCAYYKNCVKSVGKCFDFRKCPLAPKVDELLRKSPWHQRNNGKDHVLIIGMNYAMDHYIGKPKCKALLSGICSNCTKLAIDDYSFLHSGTNGIIEKGDFWHAIPFPGDFHWTREVKTPFPWENTNRPILVSYIGSVKSFYGPARRVRGSIVHYCELHPDLCVHQTYGKNGTRDSFKVDNYDPLQVSYSSVFCFQPIGDLMTRKGLFDSLLQGCIPVLFDVLTANVMYTWHWDESFWNDISVMINFHPVAFRYSDPIIELQNLFNNSIDLIRKKQKLIRERVFELQYSLEGRNDDELDVKPWLVNDGNNNLTFTMAQSLLIKNVETKRNKNMGTWPIDSEGNPMRDAYDITMDHILGWHSGLEADIRNASVPECWNGILNKEKTKCIPDQDEHLHKKKGGKR